MILNKIISNKSNRIPDKSTQKHLPSNKNATVYQLLQSYNKQLIVPDSTNLSKSKPRNENNKDLIKCLEQLLKLDSQPAILELIKDKDAIDITGLQTLAEELNDFGFTRGSVFYSSDERALYNINQILSFYSKHQKVLEEKNSRYCIVLHSKIHELIKNIFKTYFAFDIAGYLPDIPIYQHKVPEFIPTTNQIKLITKTV
ncbi:MAG: hypothetical protein GY730_05485 [bacterium]|nr:hypothetical protein [bacterium]